MANVLHNLPELPEPAPASALVGEPVAWDHLVELLKHINPDSDRGAWRDVVAGIHATNSGTEEERKELARTWSRTDTLDPDNEFETIWFGMPPKEGGAGYGTVLTAARAGVPPFKGPSAAGVEPTALSEHYQIVKLATVQPDPEEVPGTKRNKVSIPYWNIHETLSQPPPTWLVEGIIAEDENFVIYGPPKMGKSLFTLEVALSICANVKVLDTYRVVRSGPVVYLSGEGTSFLSRRVNAWLKAHNLEASAVEKNWGYIPKVPPIGDLPGLQDYVDVIRAKIGTTRPALIIVDTMSRALGANDENSAATMNLYEELSRKIMEVFKCSCWTIAHVGKDASKGLRGNNSAEGNFDTNSTFEVKGASRCFNRKQDRGFEAKPFGISVVATAHGEVLKWAPVKGSGDSKGVNPDWIRKAVIALFDHEPIRTLPLATRMCADLGKGNTITPSGMKQRLDLVANNPTDPGNIYLCHLTKGGRGDATTWHITPELLAMGKDAVVKDDNDL
jgi:hypothetical protein